MIFRTSSALLLAQILFAGPAHAADRPFTCRCYAEPGHLFAGDLHIVAGHPVQAAERLKIRCEAQAWGMFGKRQSSLATCFPTPGRGQ